MRKWASTEALARGSTGYFLEQREDGLRILLRELERDVDVTREADAPEFGRIRAASDERERHE